uniref:Uncharacterized protein n=1 Tax=Anguilla anguilla TaxID=7936 RepID=A0A0E9UR56_ANGAN
MRTRVVPMKSQRKQSVFSLTAVKP